MTQMILTKLWFSLEKILFFGLLWQMMRLSDEMSVKYKGMLRNIFSVLMRFRKFWDFRLFYYLCLYDNMHGESKGIKEAKNQRNNKENWESRNKIATSNQKVPY